MSKSLRDNPVGSEFEKLKIGTEPKSVELLDLTSDALNAIIDNLELKERLLLRKVSRELRTLVDQRESIWKTLRFDYRGDYVHATYNNYDVIYTDANCEHIRYAYWEKHNAKVIKTEEYLKMALEDFKFAIQNPELKLDVLGVKFSSMMADGVENYRNRGIFIQKLEEILNSLDHKISTKKFETRIEFKSSELLKVLPHLEPGTLRHIEFLENKNYRKISMDHCHTETANNQKYQVSRLEQWKKAGILGLACASSMWGKSQLTNFKRFEIYELHPDWKHVIYWRDFFTTSKAFEFGQIRIRPKEDRNQILLEKVQKEFGRIVSKDDDGVSVIHHSIPNDSNHFLEIKVQPGGRSIEFTKMPRSP